MSKEITVTLGLTATNGTMRLSPPTKTLRIDQSSAKYSAGVQTIGTTHEAIAIGSDVTTPGWCRFENLGSTNYVEIGVVVSAAFVPVALLKAGMATELCLAAGVVLYAKANTAAVDIECLILAA